MSWFVEHWLNIFVPFLIFIVIVVFGLWARLTVHGILIKRKPKWLQNGFVIETMWHPFFHWFLLLAAYAAIQVSILSPLVKRLTGEVLASIFTLSLIWTAISLSERFIRYFLARNKTMQSLVAVVLSVTRIVIIVTGVLMLLEIWGAHTITFIILISACFIIVGIVFRNTFDNLLAGIEIAYSEHIKIGQLIKLGSGETGYVTQISWTRTIIKSIEGNLVIIPNYRLMTNIIVNYSAATPGNSVIDIPKSASTVKSTKLLDILSGREREVLSLISQGASNQEIAKELIISEHTVKSHLRTILNKLNVRNRQQAAAYAVREGLDSFTITKGSDS